MSTGTAVVDHGAWDMAHLGNGPAPATVQHLCSCTGPLLYSCTVQTTDPYCDVFSYMLTQSIFLTTAVEYDVQLYVSSESNHLLAPDISHYSYDHSLSLRARRQNARHARLTALVVLVGVGRRKVASGKMLLR